MRAGVRKCSSAVACHVVPREAKPGIKLVKFRRVVFEIRQ